MEMQYNTRKSAFTKEDGSPVWIGMIQPGPAKTQAELFAEASRRAHVDISDVAYIEHKLRETMEDYLKSGSPVLLDWLAVFPSMTGGFDSADGSFNRERNAIVVRAHTRPPMRDCLSGMSARNLTAKLKATILAVTDNVAMLENVLTVASKILVVGDNVLINRANPDEGAFLAKKNGEIVATAEILANDASSIDLSFQELPPDGEYVLVVKARNGASTDFEPAVARRNVTVRAAI